MTEQALPAEPPIGPSAATPTATRNPFATIGYRIWWTASVVAGLGVGIQTSTVPLFIKDRVSVDHREIVIAAALMCQQLPSALFALVGGVVADRVERRRILVRTYSVAAAVSLTYVALAGFDLSIVWPVFFLSAIVGSAGAFTNPARQSMMPQILRPAQVQNGVIFGTMAFMASLQFVGPSMGGIVADGPGLTFAFAGEVLTLGSAAILFSRIATDRPQPTGRKVFRDLLDGLTYIRNRPGLLGVLVLGTVPGLFLIGPFAVTVVAMVKDVLHTSDKFVGLLWGSFGAGIVVGSVLLSLRPVHRRGFFLGLAVVFGATFEVLYSQSETVPLSMALLFVSGLTGPALFINFGVALLQENVERHMMGRVMSMWGLAFTVSSALGYLQTGIMASAFGPQTTIAVSGLIAAAFGVGTLLFFRPVTRLD